MSGSFHFFVSDNGLIVSVDINPAVLLVFRRFVVNAAGAQSFNARTNAANFTEEELARIIDYLINGDSGVTTYNLLCTLFGHKIKEGMMSMTQHHVYDTYPYCEITYYHVETCERCDYENVTIDAVERIGCCLE